MTNCRAGTAISSVMSKNKAIIKKNKLYAYRIADYKNNNIQGHHNVADFVRKNK